MLTIVLINPYPILLLGLSSFLKERFENVLIASPDLMQDLSDINPKPEIIVVDIGTGYNEKNAKILINARIVHPGYRTIIYDENPSYQTSLYFMQAGASGYLGKSSPEIIMDCIRQVSKGKRYMSIEISETGWYPCELSRLKTNMLSRREFEIANYLKDGMKISSIAKTLGVKPSAVSTSKYAILKKLNLFNVVELREKIRSGQVEAR